MKEKHKYHIEDIANLIIFYSVFACFVVAFVMGVVKFAEGNLELHKLIFRASFVLLMMVPFAIKKIFKVTFSRVTSSVYYVFMFISAFLGSVLEFYNKFPAWDMIIHFLMGAVLAVLSIYILNYTVYKKDKSRHNLFFTFLFMLLFSLGISALWEIWEFCGDLLFNIGAQRYIENGITYIGQKALMDTMLDLCMDLLGAISGILFTYILVQIRPRFLKTFVIKKLRKSEQEVEDLDE